MMKNHHFAKSIVDASWNKLVQYTTYKAESAGKLVVLVDPGNTSRLCSRCGWKKETLKLSERTFTCDSCGLEIDRDLNAASNILRMGLIKVGGAVPKLRPWRNKCRRSVSLLSCLFGYQTDRQYAV